MNKDIQRISITEEEIVELKYLIQKLNTDLLEDTKTFRIEDLTKKEFTTLVKLINKNKYLLHEREKEILLLSFGLIDKKRWSLQELSLKFKIPEKRVRQILAKGIRIVRHPEKRIKLQKILKDE